MIGSSRVQIQREILLPRMVEVSDTTLHPRETRTITLRVSLQGAQRVRARITFHLWDPDHHAAREARIAAKDLRIDLFEKVWELPTN